MRTDARGDVDEPMSAFEQLHAAMADVVGVPKQRVDPALLALAWSVAHGAAALICDGVWRYNDPRADAAIDLVVRVASEARTSKSRQRQRP